MRRRHPDPVAVRPGRPPAAGPVALARPRGRPLSRVAATALRWSAVATVLLFAWIGVLQVTRGTAVRAVRTVDAPGDVVSPGQPAFPLNVGLLTGAALSPGNRVEITLNGDETFPRLWADLRSARESIVIQMYYGLPGAVADTLRRILLDRARSGVRVAALYDAFGTSGLSAETRATLAAAGIRVVPFRPIRLSALNVLQNRSHVRAIIVDGRVGWTGGFGIDDKWLGDGRTDGSWRDTNVRFEGPAVRQLEAAVAAAWAEATGVLVGRSDTVAAVDGGGVTAGLLHTSPTLGSTAAERFLALSIAGARRSLYVTNAYFAPDANFVELLAAAARRGADVRLLLAGPRTDVRLARTAARSRYERLLAAGVRVYEWQPSSLHAKTFVVDGLWSSIGTMNFDNRSLALNDEVTVMALDSALGRRMNAVFLDDLRHAVEIDSARFRRRARHERFTEWFAGLVSRVL